MAATTSDLQRETLTHTIKYHMNAVESVIQPHLNKLCKIGQFWMLRVVRSENLTDQEKLGFVCDYVAGNNSLSEASYKAKMLNASRNK